MTYTNRVQLKAIYEVTEAVVGVEPTSSYPYVVTSTCVASSLISIAFGDEHPCDLSVFSLTPEITTRGGDRPR